MKFTISRQDLCTFTSNLQHIVAPKAPMPHLSNIAICAHQNTVVLTATDLTCTIRYELKAFVEEEGSTTVPARRFSQLLRELTSPEVHIQTDDQEITTLVADSSTFKLYGLPYSEFPQIPELENAVEIEVPAQELKDMFYKTSFAVSRDDSRYVLTGVHVAIKDKKAVFSGTDGKRLAKAALTVPCEEEYNFQAIIPLKAVEEMVKNLPANEEEGARLSFMKEKVAMRIGNMLLITKLISGDYPDIHKVIPQTVSSRVAIHREEMISLLRQIALFTGENNYSVRFSFTPGELGLSINTADVGEGRVSMPVNYQGDDFAIAFNPHFFLDLLKHSKEETVTMGFSDAFNPGVFFDGEHLEEDKEPPSALFVLMPMRLSGNSGE